jgi:hypothetical protein
MPENPPLSHEWFTAMEFIHTRTVYASEINHTGKEDLLPDAG